MNVVRTLAAKKKAFIKDAYHFHVLSVQVWKAWVCTSMGDVSSAEIIFFESKHRFPK